MKIYIEASSFYGNRTGVGRYGLSISEALIKLRPNDQFVLFSFLRPGRQINLDFELPSNAKRKFIRWFPGRAFSLLMRKGLGLPLELFGLGSADVIFFPNFIAWPSLTNKNRLSVVHDVSFLYQPEFVQAKNLKYLTTQLPKSLRRSKAVAAVSEATKKDLVQIKTSPDKITVVPNAVDHNIFSPVASNQTTQTIKKLGIPNSYLLFVGTVEPRKNIEGLLEAFAQSYPQHKLPLVIVGGKGWNDEGIERKLKDLASLPIYRTDFVSDLDLAALYAGATAFVYPSFYEGFGIPVLEAMACGCPVVCSNNSAFPEVVGDAALQVNASSIADIAAAINKVASSVDLRKQMSS